MVKEKPNYWGDRGPFASLFKDFSTIQVGEEGRLFYTTQIPLEECNGPHLIGILEKRGYKSCAQALGTMGVYQKPEVPAMVVENGKSLMLTGTDFYAVRSEAQDIVDAIKEFNLRKEPRTLAASSR